MLVGTLGIKIKSKQRQKGGKWSGLNKLVKFGSNKLQRAKSHVTESQVIIGWLLGDRNSIDGAMSPDQGFRKQSNKTKRTIVQV